MAPRRPIDLRAKARQWRASSKARAAKLGIALVLPTIDEVHAFLIAAPKVCVYCGAPLGVSKRSKLELDHRLPISRGGSASTENLALSCHHDNLSKGEMREDEYRALLAVLSVFEDGGKSVLARLKRGYF